MTARSGFSLVELVVALTVLAIGILGLAAAAALAQRTFNHAAAAERAGVAASIVLDSLLHLGRPAGGERTVNGVLVRWSAVGSGYVTAVTVTVEVDDGDARRAFAFHAMR